MREHLTPNLESKSGPEYLARNTLLGAKHMQSGFAMRPFDRWAFNIHTWPRADKGAFKIFEFLGKVVPDIPKISSGAIVKQR